MIFVIGNGNSRKDVDLKELSKYGKTIGCNALYRDFEPTHLITHDSAILHEILSTDYSLNNDVYALEFEEISFEHYDTIVLNTYRDLNINHVENEKNDSNYFIIHSSDGLYEPIGGHQSYLTWIPKKSKLKKVPFKVDIHPVNIGFNAIRLAYELYPNEEIFMLGFDIFGNRNNVYDETSGYYTNDVPNYHLDSLVFLFNYLTDLYPNINIKRVIDYGPDLEKIKTISYKELWHHLADNQKI